MKTKYTAKNLEDIAEVFDTFATQQDAVALRHPTARARAECEIRAATWRDAASIIRNTTLTVSLYDGSQLTSEPKRAR